VTSTIEVPLSSSAPVSGLRARAAVVADVGDDAPALRVDRRLVGRAALQIVVADQLHVAGFGAVTASGRLGRRGPGREHHEGEAEDGQRGASQTGKPWASPFGVRRQRKPNHRRPRERMIPRGRSMCSAC
jgi:hypothetical protein